MRAWLVVCIVLATIGFVVGTSIERHNTTHESAAQLQAEATASEPATHSEAGESATKHAAEGSSTSAEGAPASKESGESAARHAAETRAATSTEVHNELRPLGIDVEATPFVILAALASLGLAALGWARPPWLLGLATIATAMVVFGALDVREVFHQSDENQTGLVVLAAVIAALHLIAGGTAAAMAQRASRGAPGAPGTIPV